MKRRDFVKALMTAPVAARAILGEHSVAQQAPPVPPVITDAPAAPAPVPWMRGLMEVKPLPMTPLTPDAVAKTNADFFTERQFATLSRFSELLLPPHDGYPGAIEASTPKFLDFLIGASPADRQRMYQSGLDRLDAEAHRHFNRAFAEISPEQADQLIRPWLKSWLSDNPPTEPYAHFINVAHSDVRQATMSSQAWTDAALAKGEKPDLGLYWFPIDPDLHRDNFTLPRHTNLSHRPA